MGLSGTAICTVGVQAAIKMAAAINRAIENLDMRVFRKKVWGSIEQWPLFTVWPEGVAEIVWRPGYC